MKKIVVLCVFVSAFLTVSAFGQQNKVVVVPLGGSKAIPSKYEESSRLNHSSYDLTSTYAPVSPTLSFTKDHDNTFLEVWFNSRVLSGVFGDGATGIRLEIRVDGNQATYDTNGAIRASDTVEFLSMMAVFDNLTSGPHVIQIYARTNYGTSTGFLLDPGGWGGRFIVKETH